jgi:hypothetical protein
MTTALMNKVTGGGAISARVCSLPEILAVDVRQAAHTMPRVVAITASFRIRRLLKVNLAGGGVINVRGCIMAGIQAAFVR